MLQDQTITLLRVVTCQTYIQTIFIPVCEKLPNGFQLIIETVLYQHKTIDDTAKQITAHLAVIYRWI